MWVALPFQFSHTQKENREHELRYPFAVTRPLYQTSAPFGGQGALLSAQRAKELDKCLMNNIRLAINKLIQGLLQAEPNIF